MNEMTYDQKQIQALRGLVSLIFLSLSSEQKESINRCVSEDPELLDEKMPDGTDAKMAENAKAIFALMKDIISGEVNK